MESTVSSSRKRNDHRRARTIDLPRENLTLYEASHQAEYNIVSIKTSKYPNAFDWLITRMNEWHPYCQQNAACSTSSSVPLRSHTMSKLDLTLKILLLIIVLSGMIRVKGERPYDGQHVARLFQSTRVYDQTASSSIFTLDIDLVTYIKSTVPLARYSISRYSSSRILHITNTP